MSATRGSREAEEPRRSWMPTLAPRSGSGARSPRPGYRVTRANSPVTVRSEKPLHVSVTLIQGVTQPCTITGSAGELSAKDPSSEDQSLAVALAEGSSHDVPEQFRRAFDD
jgi:hypothetical protein